MPDPLTSADVEDVLGSIRRLVSEEAAAKAKKGGEADKLVLTPAHRVGEPEAPGDGPLRLGEPVGGPAATTDLAEELADLEARMSERAERWREDDHLSPPEDIEALEEEAALAGIRKSDEPAADLAEPEIEPEGAVAEAAEPGSTQEDPAAGAVEGDTQEREAEAGESDPVEEEAAAEPEALEPAVEEPDAEAPAPEAEIAEAEEPDAEAPEHEAEIAETEAVEVASEAEASDATDEGSAAEEEEFAIAEEDSVAADEEAFGLEAEELAAEDDDASDYDAWEPAGEEGQPGFRGPGAAGAEAVLEEPPIEAALVRLATAPSLPEAAENVGKPDLESLLDEAELRALVAEVLREELKGPLGERITRNVRKLVRREIAQALSSMDID